jgi:hypothetical protein
MKHFARLMLLTLGLGVIAVVVSSFPRQTATAAPKNTLIQDVNNPANEPFAKTLCFATAAGGCNGAPGQFTVPTVVGAPSAPVERLVIEYYSAQCQFSNAADGGLNLEVITAGSDNFYYIGPLSLDASVPGASQANPYKCNQQTRIYADPGTPVYLNTGSGVGPGSITCTVTVSGYLSLK